MEVIKIKPSDSNQKLIFTQGKSIFLLAKSLKPFKNNKTNPTDIKKDINTIRSVRLGKYKFEQKIYSNQFVYI
mgnify:CR=1 FL=1